MVQRRSYPRTPLERQGQVNWRGKVFPRFTDVPVPPQDAGDPNCVIIVTKRKELFGLVDNRQSQPMSRAGADVTLPYFPSKHFYRYKVNVYLKKKE